MILPDLAPNQLLRITPNVGPPRLILSARTGLLGAKSWAEHAATTRGATTFVVVLITTDEQTNEIDETVLGTADLTAVAAWL